ncbi:MAG: hypothetical protein AAGF98_18925, partial [Cyanobacteria bacterium P01_H01_bin.153]
MHGPSFAQYCYFATAIAETKIICHLGQPLGKVLDRAFEGKLWLSEFKSFYKKIFESWALPVTLS